MLRSIARAVMLRRLLESSSRHRRSSYGYGHGHRSHRGRSGGFHFMGPFPAYSRRTRGGSRVSVGGCCLPIPLALAVAPAAGWALMRRR